MGSDWFKNRDTGGWLDSSNNSSSWTDNIDTSDWFNSNESDWFADWSNIFDDISSEPEEDSSWWNTIVDFANSETGSGIISGLGSGLGSYLDNKSKEDQFDRNLDFKNKEFLQRQEEFKQKLALEQEALALQQAILDDKVNTRRRHNESINKKPGIISGVRFK